MSIWFTADLHLGHSKIIKYCKRPFANIKEMDEVLIANWNKVVKPEETIFILGDFAWKKLSCIQSYLLKLNGRKILVAGSHDEGYRSIHSNLVYSRHDVLSIRYGHSYPWNQNIVLCHYPLARWDKSHYGSWHLYGHCHGGFQNVGKSFDVGVDCHNYFPISFEEVAELMKNRPDNPNLIRNEKNA